jgi:hypothetical protein
MDMIIGTAFDSGSFFFLAGLIAASMVFIMLGIRWLKLDRHEGFMFIALAAFFLIANLAFLLIESSSTIISSIKLNFTFWHWIALLVGPAVIILYFVFGLYNLLKFEVGEAILKTILGIALIMILYAFGYNWSEIIKSALVLIFCIGWFTLELKDCGDAC